MRAENENQFVFSTGAIAYPIAFVLSIWIVFWLELKFGLNFNNWGVNPRNLKGLRGVLFSPFIHANLKHLFNNTIPLFVLTTALFYFYRRISWKVLLFGLLLTGMLTWLIGRPSNHIGASDIIYMLTGFLFFKGIFSKHYRLIALSLIVVFLYGGLLWYIMPVDPQVSWEGHLSGLLSGIILSFFYKSRIAKAPKYEWEKEEYNPEADPFMKHFDEDGNFIETPSADLDNNSFPEVTYHYKPREDSDRD